MAGQTIERQKQRRENSPRELEKNAPERERERQPREASPGTQRESERQPQTEREGREGEQRELVEPAV